AWVPGCGVGRGCGEVVDQKTVAAPHLGQGLLHRADAANVVGGKLVALPAGLPLAVVEPVDLSLVTTLDRGGFEIVRALARAHESIGSDSRSCFDLRHHPLIPLLAPDYPPP